MERLKPAITRSTCTGHEGKCERCVHVSVPCLLWRGDDQHVSLHGPGPCGEKRDVPLWRGNTALECPSLVVSAPSCSPVWAGCVCLKPQRFDRLGVCRGPEARSGNASKLTHRMRGGRRQRLMEVSGAEHPKAVQQMRVQHLAFNARSDVLGMIHPAVADAARPGVHERSV